MSYDTWRSKNNYDENYEKSSAVGGSIEISPIEVGTHSISSNGGGTPTQQRRSVQFSDKVQRFPESAPTSPKPLDTPTTTKDVANKTPLDIASESLNQHQTAADNGSKKVEVSNEKISDSKEDSKNSKPQIDSFIDVKMEKRNDPDLVIEFNSPISNSSTNFNSSPQQQEKISDNKQNQEQNQNNFKPSLTTADTSYSSSHAAASIEQQQPPHHHVKNENVNDNSNFNGNYNNDKPFVTTVILNVEMVRTPKETDPEDDWDTDLVKVSFSTGASFGGGQETETTNNYTEQQSANNVVESVAPSAIPVNEAKTSPDEKPPRSPQFGQSKEGLNPIDLTPLLNAAPATDIAVINAGLNRTPSITEDFPEGEGNKSSTKASEQTTENDKTKPQSGGDKKSIEIPIQFEGQPPVAPVDFSLPNYGSEKVVEIPIIFDESSKDKSHSENVQIQFGVIPQKAVEIPIQFHEDKPVTPVDIPLSEFGSPGESKIEIAIIFESDSKPNEKEKEKSGGNEKGIIEIPIQFENGPTVAKVDVPLSEYGTPPLTQQEIPIIISDKASDSGKADNNELEIKVVEIPIHFEGQEAPAIPFKDKEISPAPETSTEIPIIFENQKDGKESSNEKPHENIGIEIPIQFDGQPTVAKVDIPLSKYGTPAETTIEVPIIFDENNQSIINDGQNEGEYTEISVIQFGSGASQKASDTSAEANEAKPSASDVLSKQAEAFENEQTGKVEGQPETQTATSDYASNKLQSHGIEIPIQHEGQPEVQKVDIPLSQFGIPAETKQEIMIIFETPKDDQKASDNNEKDLFGLLQNKVIEIPIQFEDCAPVSKIDVPLSEFGFPAETLKEIPIRMEKDAGDENKDKAEKSGQFGTLPFKLIEIPIQHEGQPEVKKVDIPLSEFGIPSESLTEIAIIFEEKDDEEVKPKVDDEKKQDLEDNKNEISQPKVEEGQKEAADSNKTMLDQNEKVNNEIPQTQEEEEPETTTEIPVIFENQEKRKEETIPVSNPDEQNKSESSTQLPSTETGANEAMIEIPVIIEKQENQKESASAVESKDSGNKDNNSSQNISSNDEKASDIGISIPITIDYKPQENEPDKRQGENENVSIPSQPAGQTSSTTPEEQKQVVGVIFQTSFAKPMVDDNTSLQNQKAAEPIPESNEVKYQNSFAKPLDTAEKKEEKPDEKTIENNYQSNFAKPMESSQQMENNQKTPEGATFVQKSEEPKISNESKESENVTQIPIKIDISPLINESPKLVSENRPEVNKTQDRSPYQIDDKVESSLFSSPSPIDEDNFWIEVPASGVVRDIPISIQKTGAPSTATATTAPSSTSQPTSNSTTTPDKTQRDEQSHPEEKKQVTNTPSLESQKSVGDDGVTYYEVTSSENKQQQPQNQGSQQPSLQNEKTPSDQNWVGASTKADNKTSDGNFTQPSDNSVRSPTSKKYDDNNSMELNIQEYEDQLRKNTQEALNLVDKLCESSLNQQEKNRKEREREREHEHEKERERERERRSSRSQSRERSVQFNESQLEAQSYKVNPDLMQEPTTAILLPEHRLALSDYQFGLSIFNLHTKDLKRIDGGNKWRRPHHMIYLPRAKHLLVLCEYSEKEDGNYQLFICRFSLDLEYINRVEAPVLIRDKEIITFRLCHSHRTDCLYLAASTFNTGYVYELSPEGFWREVYTGRNKVFNDISVFAVIGPVTELMLVENIKDYIVVVSIYNSQAADTRTIAACEKPSALAIDEKGTVIIYDRCSCKVGIHSRLDNLRVHDIALVEHRNCNLSAFERLLAVLVPSKKDLRLYKY